MAPRLKVNVIRSNINNTTVLPLPTWPSLGIANDGGYAKEDDGAPYKLIRAMCTVSRVLPKRYAMQNSVEIKVTVKMEKTSVIAIEQDSSLYY